MNVFRKVLVFLCSVFIFACGGTRSDTTDFERTLSHISRGDVLVQVDNEYWSPGNLYGVTEHGTRFKIGFIAGIGNYSFWVPSGEYGGTGKVDYLFVPTGTRGDKVYRYETGAPVGIGEYPYLLRGAIGIEPRSVIKIRLMAKLDQSYVLDAQNE